MAYKKRFDGRAFDELRPMEAKAGVIKNAQGSGYFKIGKTAAYAAVYGPRECVPKFQSNPKKGVLRVNYNMMPFAGQGGRVRPGPNRRAKEISEVSKLALETVLDLSAYPNSAIDVFIELPQTDAGSRCAGITAAAIALADAGLKMKDMVSAVAVGFVDDKVCVDLDYNEEAYDHVEGGVEGAMVADIPVAMVPSTGEITLLQMDGLCISENVIKALESAKDACEKIKQVQIDAIKNKYTTEDAE
ncbi:MAG: exosome complex exonuclease Rrp41 [Candidatus Woesearchaeota archaeon]